MLAAAMSGMLVVCAAALWPKAYTPLAKRQKTVADKWYLPAVALATIAAGVAAASMPDIPLLAAICGVMIVTDLMYRHLSLPLQVLALVLAMGRLMSLQNAQVHLIIGIVLALIYLALALFESASGLGDVSILAVVGLVAGPAAPIIVTVGALIPLVFVAFGRIGAREPQPLAAWWLLALLFAMPFVA